jgi:uncharacterized coiled-coil DUF342 family protein
MILMKTNNEEFTKLESERDTISNQRDAAIAKITELRNEVKELKESVTSMACARDEALESSNKMAAEKQSISNKMMALEEKMAKMTALVHYLTLYVVMRYDMN